MSHILIHSRTTFPEANTTSKKLYDLALLSSYNKSEKMDVPVFLKEHKNRVLPLRETVVTGIPVNSTHNGIFQDSIASPARAIAMVMTDHLRFEPLNNTPMHRSYPSARGLFPIEIDFVFVHAEGETRLVFDESHEALRPRAGHILRRQRRHSALRIELTMAMERIAPHYGDLALSLCFFEIGHLTEQICAALRVVGCEYECRLLPCPGAQAANDGTRSLAPLKIVLVGQSFLSPCEEDCTAALRIPEVILTRTDRERCIRACQWAESSGGKPRIIDGIGRHDLFPIPNTSEKCVRSSGNSIMGMRGQLSTIEEQNAYIASIIESFQAIQDSQFPWPAMTILRANSDCSVTAIYVSDTVHTKQIENGWTSLSEAYGTFFNVDLQTICLFVLFSAPFAKILKESPWSYAEILVGAGILSQIICNDAAARGFIARPWKGMIEEQLEAAFNLEGQCFYSLAMGKCDLCNPALSVSRLRSLG